MALKLLTIAVCTVLSGASFQSDGYASSVSDEEDAMDSKVFKDCVHGHMIFHRVLVKIINTPEFHRLRNIKQLGTAYYVYPSASHNRFEHSLGTCHLAGKLLNSIGRTVKIDDRDALCVQIAALCHDLGHGPFSHTWERFLLSAENIKWTHEQASIELFERIMSYPDIEQEFEMLNMGRAQVEFIKALILGEHERDVPSRRYLYQIVCNKDNDIDVDKWDYILRDRLMLKCAASFDVERLLDFCQVLPVSMEDGSFANELCFRDKEVHNIFDMLIARAALHEKAYQHQVVKVIEAMIIDALVAAHRRAPELKMTDIRPENIAKLTDHIYYTIKSHGRMVEANTILERIERRHLYKIMHVCKLDDRIHEVDGLDKSKIELDIYTFLLHYCPGLRETDIGVVDLLIGLGSVFRDGDGINVKVFSKNNRTARCIDRSDSTHLLAPALQRRILRNEILVLYKGTADVPALFMNKSIWAKVDCIIKTYCHCQHTQLRE